MDDQFHELTDSNTSTNKSDQSNNEDVQRRNAVIWMVIGIIFILAVIVTSLVFLLSPNTTPLTVARIRDIFIIFMAVESLFVGIVLVILMVQLARLINLLQNEVQPILDSTNDTISNLRGTTEFISANLVEPVIKLNEYLAGLQKITELLGLKRKR